MKAMLLNRLTQLEANSAPLELASIAEPIPGANDILIRVSACGVCHTELDEIEGRMPPPRLPIVPGHQVVGRVAQAGKTFKVGERAGVAWISSTCGRCSFCLRGDENLCANFRATGRDTNGGYAEFIAVPEDFAFPIPDIFTDAEAAPLLCAGAIGYRSLRLAQIGDGQHLGLVGFGASAHLVLKLARHQFPHARICVFCRSESEQAFARELGAEWAGDVEAESPAKLNAIIDTTPAWKPIVHALANLAPGGRLVINAIRKEPIDQDTLAQIDYPKHLWMEKEIKSVANVTRRDVSEFLEIAARIPLKPELQEFALGDANQALWELKMRRIRGAKVLRID